MGFKLTNRQLELQELTRKFTDEARERPRADLEATGLIAKYRQSQKPEQHRKAG